MEIFRETAMAYYNGGPEELKQDIKKRFNKLDKDKDGRLSLKELRKGYNFGNEVFKRFDRDNNGTLDFQEFITFYYATKSCWHWCKSCGVTLTTFFTCVQCFGGSSTFDLCCECYGGRKFTHNHSNFMDNRSLLEKQRESSLKRDSMESLRKIATTYYNKGSKKVKRLVKDFFHSLDENRDGKISLHEFLSFMTQKGYSQMSNRYFFEVLDKDGNKTLDFDEVLALYYVMRSGRRFCGGCDCFLDGMYLTCVPCFETNAVSFCICFDCYRDNKYIHMHSSFLDNFALLEMKRQAKTAPKPQYGQCENAWSSSSSSVVIYEDPERNAGSSPSSSLVPYQPPKKSKRSWNALKALEVAINLASLAANFGCTIM